MKFNLAKAPSTGNPFLLSEDTVFSIRYLRDTDLYECWLEGTGDLFAFDETLEDLVEDLKKKLKVNPSFSERDLKTFKSYVSEIRNKESITIKAKKEMDTGAYVDFDLALLRLIVTRADGKYFSYIGKAVESLIHEFSQDPASNDVSVSFEDWILVKSLQW